MFKLLETIGKKYIEFLSEEMKMNKSEIKAVYGEDLEEYLDSLGVLEDVKSGNKTCFYCGVAVNINDISTIFPEHNDVQICCSDFGCYQKLMRERD